MFLEKNKDDLEDLIIKALHEKALTGPALFDVLNHKNKTISKETFYRVLRKLIQSEVLNKNKKVFQLNRHWLQQVYRFSKKHIETNIGTDADNILNFKEGDKITYTFRTPNHMGIYWAHLYDMCFDVHDPTVPILIFHPHEWLIHTRIQSETFFLNRFEEDKKLVLFLIGGSTAIDKEFKKTWSSKFREIGIGINPGLQKNEYINVLGDFIFKISTSEQFRLKIDDFFQKNQVLTDSSKKELEKICNENAKIKMVFMKSKKEAEKWRTRYKKYFYIPKGYHI